ncbi:MULTISPECIES: gas vesicle protein GvpG [unclassified Rhodococcus (in: high G+C Gram-positive bacteria)]|uniref:gas vesicle protein GvpG n=1 Tax=Rhodococcus sp. SJ-3 TaxID=3454628 RepID=UPI003F79E735
MGLVTSLLTLPLAPIKGVLWLGEVIQEQVEQQMHDPANMRRELEQIEQAWQAGELTQQQMDDAQQEVLNRMMTPDASAADRRRE